MQGWRGAGPAAGHLLNHARDWLMELLDQLAPLAESLQLNDCLKPLDSLLVHGNQAMRWETAHGQGQAIEDLLQKGIQRMEE